MRRRPGLVVAAGNLIVAGARGIAVSFGIDAFIIGTTIVAVGTSMPELATTVIAKLRGHDEVSLETIIFDVSAATDNAQF